MFKTILGTPLEDVKKAGAEESARLAEFLEIVAQAPSNAPIAASQ